MGAVDDTTAFFRSWAWKREHRPDRDRFHRPYKHQVDLPGCDAGPETTSCTVTIQQQKFGPEGFASTVWDSSIVMAKYMERHADRYRGKRCLDLSAGCGLVGVVLAKLGALVTATDLAPNLPLLARNCESNVPSMVQVREHRWGGDVAPLTTSGEQAYDVIVACDVMYLRDAVGALVQSLSALSDSQTEVLVGHGRNRFAEEEFMQAARRVFDVVQVGREELHPVYQCSDVDIWRLVKHGT